MESILVTGCLGFIGSHLLEELLLTDSKIVGIDAFTYAANKEFFKTAKEKCEIQKVDICDLQTVNKLIDKYDIKKIINLAAETHVDNSIVDASQFLRTNLMGVHSLLEATKRRDIEFIQFSTDEVYGPADSGVSFCELSSIKPQNPYSASKAAADMLIQSYRNTYGINAKILRPSNNFGPRQHPEKLLSKALTCIRQGKRIPVYGNGRQVRQWTYVEDTAKAVRHLIENNCAFDVVNISSEHEIENIEVLEYMCSLLSVSLVNTIEYVEDRPGHDLRYSISSKKLHGLIDLNFTDFKSALKKTVLV